ncbi:MAG TPA: M13 family metallopeptidase [Cyclobacteriaceae bacterium]|nr:M13 family metallopeptidase [Cyclobacteriaceae bacterium]
MRFRYVAACLIGVLILACSDKKNPENETHAIDTALMDTTVRVQDDLFLFANGTWLKTNTIPAEYGSWDTFYELFENSEAALIDILKRTSAKTEKDGSDQQKAADFFSIGMDSMRVENTGAAALKPFLDLIEGIKDKQNLSSYLAEDALTGGDVLLFPYIDSDAKDSKKPRLWMYSTGLGLPERDYYLKSDDKSKEIRAKYEEHMSNMFALAGAAPDVAKKQAGIVMKIETQLAKSMMSKEDTRDPQKTYNPVHTKEFAAWLKPVDVADYLKGIHVKEDTLIATDPGYFKGFGEVVRSYSLDDFKVYLTGTLLRKSSRYLNHAFVQESFEFNSKYLNGVEALRPRWKRVLATVDNSMGEALGKLYVDEKFPPEAKAKAQEMVEYIKRAFAARINKLEWMSDSTKQKALAKLEKFNVKIGYPDKWRDYSGLKIDTDPETASYLGNVMNATRFETERNIGKLGKTIDRTEWMMTPQTINAYYNSSFNEIVFPAAILQPPFYNYKADEAVNYGAIGGVIGHEISHGFDDSGSQFDGEGNLKNWWTEDDLAKFKANGKALADQYSKFEALPGVFVNGEYTLGENIGDLAGLTVAYEGLQLYYKEHGRPEPIDGFTAEQRFFLSWATAWRGLNRDESLRTQVMTDPHSPNVFRANGPPSNMPEFYEAFGVKKGDKMYREEGERVKVW